MNPLNIPDFPEETEYPEEFLSRYELLELLSEKQSSRTLLVRDRSSGTLCVAKCYERDNPLYERIEPEALKALSSPALPALIAKFHDDRMHCVLREYVPGESLDRVCRKRSFSDKDIICIGKQLCEQLLLLHQLDPPVIHRDIKPENVIMRPDGQVILIDFEIAREYRPDSSDTFIMGTKGFAAPEQYGFSQTDVRSDIYSLGMLLSSLRKSAQEGTGRTACARSAGQAAQGNSTNPTDQAAQGNSTNPTDQAAQGNSTNPAGQAAQGNSTNPTGQAAQEGSSDIVPSESEESVMPGRHTAFVPEPSILKDKRAGASDSVPLARIIRKCCAFDPSRRYQNTKELLQALKKAENVRTPGWYGIRIAAALLPVIALAAILWFRTMQAPPAVTFREPLVEECVRMQLSLSERAPIPAGRLSEVTGLYIVYDKACPDERTFYEQVNQLYKPGPIPRGTMSSLEDAALLPSLTKVCVAAEALSDIEVLAGREHLEKVEIKHNDVTDISPLAGLPSLASVGINDNPVTDLSPLESCPALSYLDLCDVQSYDASIFERLGNFHYLDVANPTDSYRFLEGKQIQNLRLAWTSLSSLDDLASVSGLEELDISHTSVTDLSGLEVHKNLKRLNLAGLYLKDLAILNQLPALESVTVSRYMEQLINAVPEPEFTVFYE